ncbi:HpcH/HpaI aldolase family protein [Demequina pelophila]|uniref:HpcH/HpaI aldolase family protein n=1 Tax=Demequina pelophila TaxID=1638984 RepID=UPI0009E2B01E|nr:aldolase/citrate lyase family protein [Demequina pelophila]
MEASMTVAGAHAEALRAGGVTAAPTFGVWSGLADPAVAELLASSALGFVCVDLQHGLATFSELPAIVQAMRAAGRAPVVRVPWNDAVSIMRALDTGAAAVIVPMVNAVAEAEAAAAAFRFPPEGGRSWGPMWGPIRNEPVPPVEQQNREALCLVMIETADGVANAQEILDLDGVDGVFIGPNDLALDCGYGRATYRDSDEVAELIQGLVDLATARGKVAGLYCSDVEMARDWAGRGATMLSACHDAAVLRGALDAVAAELSDTPRGVSAPVRAY